MWTKINAVNFYFRWNYDHSNPTYHPRRNSRVDYTINLHPDISTVGRTFTLALIAIIMQF